MLSRVKLIAEPWDVGPGGYQVGGFPPGWSEWNGHYRDTMRDFWRGADERRRRSRRASPARATSTARPAARRPRRSTSSPPTTASRSPISSPTSTSTTRRTSRTTATATTTTAPGTAASRGRPTTRRSARCASRQQRNMLATLLLSQGMPMLRRRRRARPHAARQQQRLVPGQRGLVARLGRDRSGERAGRLHEAAACAPQEPRGVQADAVPRRRPRRVGAAGRVVVPSRRPADGPARLARAATPRRLPEREERTSTQEAVDSTRSSSS